MKAQSTQITENLPTIDAVPQKCLICGVCNVIKVVDNIIYIKYNNITYKVPYDINIRKFLRHTHICDCCHIQTHNYGDTYLHASDFVMHDGSSSLYRVANVKIECVESVKDIAITSAVTKEIFDTIVDCIKLKVPFKSLTLIVNNLGLTVDELLSVNFLSKCVSDFGYNIAQIRRSINIIMDQRLGINFDEPSLDTNWNIHNRAELLKYIDNTYFTDYITSICKYIKDVDGSKFIDPLVDEFIIMAEECGNCNWLKNIISRLIRLMLDVNNDIARGVVVRVAPLLIK